MEKRMVFSERKTKAAAALAGITLDDVNERAGLGIAYVSRKWGRDNLELTTLNRIADAIGCSAVDLLEEVAGDAPPPPRRYRRRGESAQPPAPAPSAAESIRQKQRDTLLAQAAAHAAKGKSEE